MGLAELGKSNRERIYMKMVDLRKTNPEEPITRNELVKIFSEFSARTIDRFLRYEVDSRTPRVFQISRGRYRTDVATKDLIDKNKQVQSLLKLGVHDLRGKSQPSFLGFKGRQIPINIIGFTEGYKNIRKRVVKNRLRVHNNKSMADGEADVYLSSFMRSLNIKINSTDPHSSLLRGNMISNIRSDLSKSFIEHKTGVRLSELKLGSDAIVFESALKIMHEVCNELVDFNIVDSTLGTKVEVTISIDIPEFLNAFYNRCRLALEYENKRVYEDLMNERIYKMWRDVEEKNDQVANEFNELLTKFFDELNDAFKNTKDSG